VKQEHIAPLLAAFPPPDHYLSQTAIEEALRRRSQFNIIYNHWGIKVDVMIPDEATRELDQFGRGLTITRTSGQSIRFAAPEHVIIKKLEYFQIGGSEKHLRDIAGMLKLSHHPIDRDYIAHWADKFGALETWQLILEKAGD
jgi:hypothetical protein